jgi:hypothetical protein
MKAFSSTQKWIQMMNDEKMTNHYDKTKKQKHPFCDTKSFVKISRRETGMSSTMTFGLALLKRSERVSFSGRRIIGLRSSRRLDNRWSSSHFNSSLSVQRNLAVSFVESSNCIYPVFGYHSLYIEKTEEECQGRPNVLACSSDSLIENRSFYKCWIRFLQRWFRNIWDFFLIAHRITEVALRLSPLVILSPVAALSGSPLMADVAWRYLVSAVQGCGPVATKFAQWIATRRDIFPPVLCDRLGILHDKGYPHSFSYTLQTLKEAFGEDYQSKGLHVRSQDVIGCGSAAQVYRGTLVTKDVETGKQLSREVAVKVLHPDFYFQVNRDLKLIERLANFAHALPSDMIKMLNLPRATETFGSALCLQADLTNEAKNLNQFRSNFYLESTLQEDESSIVFPRPINAWSSPKVVVEDYIRDAVPISHFLKDTSPDGIAIRKELAGPLLRAFLKMVFIDNFVSFFLI